MARSGAVKQMEMAQSMSRAGNTRIEIDHNGKPSGALEQHDTLARTSKVRPPVDLATKIQESEGSEALVLTGRDKADTTRTGTEADTEAAEADQEARAKVGHLTRAVAAARAAGVTGPVLSQLEAHLTAAMSEQEDESTEEAGMDEDAEDEDAGDDQDDGEAENEAENGEEGQGHCQGNPVYQSAAWELAPSSGGKKDFSTPEYKAWVDKAWKLCMQKNAQVKFVSVWTDAGYRCYTSSICSANGDSDTKTWKKAENGEEE